MRTLVTIIGGSKRRVCSFPCEGRRGVLKMFSYRFRTQGEAKSDMLATSLVVQLLSDHPHEIEASSNVQAVGCRIRTFIENKDGAS